MVFLNCTWYQEHLRPNTDGRFCGCMIRSVESSTPTQVWEELRKAMEKNFQLISSYDKLFSDPGRESRLCWARENFWPRLDILSSVERAPEPDQHVLCGGKGVLQLSEHQTVTVSTFKSEAWLGETWCLKWRISNTVASCSRVRVGWSRKSTGKLVRCQE